MSIVDRIRVFAGKTRSSSTRSSSDDDALQRMANAYGMGDDPLIDRVRKSEDLNRRGGLLLQQMKWEPALNLFEQPSKLYPEGSAAAANKVRALTGLGRWNEVIQAANAILERNPMVEVRGAMWLQKGVALVELDRFTEALPCFEEAVKTPGSEIGAAVHYSRGLAYSGLGNARAAVESFQSYLKIATNADAETVAHVESIIRRLESPPPSGSAGSSCEKTGR